jgi:hypothetical protein
MHNFHSIFDLGSSVLLYLRLIGVMVFGWIIYQWRHWSTVLRETSARKWPQTEAAILHGSVESVPNTQIFEAMLVYSYIVDQYREGRYCRDFAAEPDASRFVQCLQGKKVPVKYKPSNPACSVIETSSLDALLSRPSESSSVP